MILRAELFRRLDIPLVWQNYDVSLNLSNLVKQMNQNEIKKHTQNIFFCI